MLRRLSSSIFRKANLPYLQEQNWILLRQLNKRLKNVPRYKSGEVSINGWDLEYLDAPSLVSAFDTVVLKGWNDFYYNDDRPIILDCGANIGIATIHYKKLFPNAQITAFEPDHNVCEMMRRNLNKNGISDVNIVEAAVWKENGELDFFSEGSDAGRLSREAGDDVNLLITQTPEGKLYPVKTVRLADFLTESTIDFIKLDIEGAESEVISDCGNYLKNVNQIVIECHFMNNRPRELATIIGVLSDVKFNVAVNSYGQWIDLSNKNSVKRNSVEYDQYFLISAWRD